MAADVIDAEAVRAAVSEAEAAAGTDHRRRARGRGQRPAPARIAGRSPFLQTLAPKLGGLRNHRSRSVRQDRLKLLVAFGSIIARTGLPGEADYGVANEWLARLTERFQQEHPACRCLALEWSVWSGVGMGDRLGRVEALARQEITPIPPDEGVALFRRLVGSTAPPVSLVVAGRFGIPPALPIEADDLPLLRFLERPMVDYPGVELVAEATLATESDPYLDDHVFRGERLFPAVHGDGGHGPGRDGGAPDDRGPGLRRPAVRSSHRGARRPAGDDPSGRAGDGAGPRRCGHPRRRDGVPARSFPSGLPVRSRAGGPSGRCESRASIDRNDSAGIPIDPRAELYGHLLFQGGRFRRLSGYRRLRSTSCVAEIAGAEPAEWFHRYLPPALVLGDPAARDAAIHAIQACIPQATILPIGVDRLIPGVGGRTGPHLVQGSRTIRSGRSPGLRRGDRGRGWAGPRAMGGPSTARGRAPRAGGGLAGALAGPLPGAADARRCYRGSAWRWKSSGMATRSVAARSDRLFRRALGEGVPIARRPDGKPEVADRRGISAAHARDWTVAVAGHGTIACDLEPVAAHPVGPLARSPGCRPLGAGRAHRARDRRADGRLGDPRLGRRRVPGQGRRRLDGPDGPHARRPPRPPSCSGPDRFRIATFVLPDRRTREPLVLGLLSRTDDARL